MLKQIEGSQGVAQAVALCRPEVICAYPISPQTHIVEALGTMTRKGLIPNCEYINVESEFAPIPVAIGASVGGARAYTATASQGLLYMVEAVYKSDILFLLCFRQSVPCYFFFWLFAWHILSLQSFFLSAL